MWLNGLIGNTYNMVLGCQVFKYVVLSYIVVKIDIANHAYHDILKLLMSSIYCFYYAFVLSNQVDNVFIHQDDKYGAWYGKEIEFSILIT